jgi:DNA-dependent RNA polymerase auxiliary subunit epsilon
MARRTHIQRDFSGGVISPKMLMRQDTDVYKRSALAMRNYIPTPQGTALRAPGTRYVQALDDPNVRIFPYLTPGNDRSLVVLTPESCDIFFNVNERTREDYSNVEEVSGELIFRRRVNPNHSFRKGLEDWVGNPLEYDGADGFPDLGVTLLDTQNVRMRPRLYNDPGDGIPVCTLEQQFDIDVATTVATLRYRARYGNNWAAPGDELGGYDLLYQVSDDPAFATTLYSRLYNSENFPNIGTIFYEETNFNLPTADWTGTLYVRITATAKATPASPYSNPFFIINFLEVYANGSTPIEAIAEPLVTPYTAAELPDVHYVQSPYNPKEMVFTHPTYPPQRLTFDNTTGLYEWEAIPFENQPPEWQTNNYPATCSAVSGRLVLAGGATSR